jgi:transposase
MKTPVLFGSSMYFPYICLMENKTGNMPIATLSPEGRLSVLLNENQALKEDVAKLRFELSRLQRYLFGQSRERFIPADPSQQVLFDIPPAVEVKTTEILVPEHVKKSTTITPKKGHGRDSIDPSFPRRTTVIEPENLPEGAVKIGEEVTEVLEITPRTVYVKQIIRPKYVLASKQAIVIAALPSLPIPKGNAGPSILAFILMSKFTDHLPMYRTVRILRRDGLTIAESTLNDWFMAAGRLLEPLYQKLQSKMIGSDYLMADETPIAVLESEKKGATHKGYMWAYNSPPNRLAYFEYQKGRGKEYPKAFLDKFKGALQTDGYSGYDELGSRMGITHLACMAHVRRKFFEALGNDPHRAKAFIDQIKQLYEIEDFCRQKQLAVEDRKAIRQEKAVPILQKMHTCLNSELSLVLPKSPIGTAIIYALKLWPRLWAYTQNGVWEIDNNIIENSIRPIALGRKNYLFCGSHESAKYAAMMYSFMATCKLNNVEPQAWLTYVFDVISDYKANKLEELLPTQGMNIPNYHGKMNLNCNTEI